MTVPASADVVAGVVSADVVVVGAGTAGAVLASYAARAGASVVVLEAGPDPGPWPSPAWPADLTDADRVGTSHDWGYSGPAAGGRVLPFPRARLIGGCSSHNGCTQSIGWRGDWDAWGASSRGWASAEIGRHRAHAMKRLRIDQPSAADLQPFQRAFLDAAVAAGLPHRDDLLDLDGGAGVAISPVNAPGSVRWNSAFAYLDPVRDHPGLTVCANALVDRIEFTSQPGRPRRAVAVIALIDGRRTRIRAGQVIVCAGVYGSAEILLRSGIGPAAGLRRLGIPVVSDMPGVGANLHDHPTAIRSFAAAPALARELDQLSRVPDEQVVAKLSTGRDAAGAPYDLHVFPWTERDPAAPGGWRVTVPVALMRPSSRGALTLRSADPAVRAHADHAYLSDRNDTERLAAGLAALDPILEALPLGEELGEPPPRPGPAAAAWLQRNHEHYWHPAGTCAMGDGPNAVVSETGTVHGLANVQIADASIFPDVPRATTAFPTVLVAERMAETAFGPLPAPRPSAR